MLAGGVIRTASSRKASGWTSTALSESSDQYQFLEVLPSPRELAHSPSIPGDVLIVHADRGVRRTVSGEIPYRHWKEAPSGQAIADSYLGKIEGNVKEEVRGRGHFIRTKVPFERPPPTLSFFASSYDPPRNCLDWILHFRQACIKRRASDCSRLPCVAAGVSGWAALLTDCAAVWCKRSRSLPIAGTPKGYPHQPTSCTLCDSVRVPANKTRTRNACAVYCVSLAAISWCG